MDTDPISGRMIAGKYAVEQRLGDGAMGTVYRARQVSLDKVVALKVLHAELVGDERFVESFHREARAASRLDHPNSIHVIDFGQEPDGLLYIAMEHVDGRDLFTLLREEAPLARARVAEMASQILAALAVAHGTGVLHCDLKPENVLVVRGRSDDDRPIDVVKVCDFGIARVTGSAAAEGEPVAGTPHYMSPEQARGGALDARSDLYSVGVILYEMLTGQVPFDAATPAGILLRHAHDEPVAPHELCAMVDPRLEAICLKAMSKDPGERYASARAMRSELRSAMAAWAREEGSDRVDTLTASVTSVAGEVSARSPSARRPGRQRVASVAAAAAAMVVVAISKLAASGTGGSPIHAAAATTLDPKVVAAHEIVGAHADLGAAARSRGAAKSSHAAAAATAASATATAAPASPAGAPAATTAPPAATAATASPAAVAGPSAAPSSPAVADAGPPPATTVASQVAEPGEGAPTDAVAR